MKWNLHYSKEEKENLLKESKDLSVAVWKTLDLGIRVYFVKDIWVYEQEDGSLDAVVETGDSCE